MIEFTVADLPYKYFDNEIERVKNWLRDSIVEEEFNVNEICIINCSDEYLLEVNKKYLSHDFYTDVITFDYVVDKELSGDIFISQERIEDNAIKFDTTPEHEFLRVIIHGVLHLCGYDDHKEEDKKLIRSKEDYYLRKF